MPRPCRLLAFGIVCALPTAGPLAALPAPRAALLAAGEADSMGIDDRAPEHETECVGGSASGYPCRNVDLMSFLSINSFDVLPAFNASATNSLWGWTDLTTGKEYALLGLDAGTAFVDISTPDHPVYLGYLKRPAASSNSSWRDIRVAGDTAYIVSEAANHGMQVFDLTRLRSVASPPAAFTADFLYDEFLRAHTVAVDPASNLIIAVGSQQGDETCGSGMHFVDVSTPLAPVFAGCFAADGYVHETQCVLYLGPDADHLGEEICLGADVDALAIVDASNRAAPALVNTISYPDHGYVHQGWLTEDQRYFLLNDELDEQNLGHPTRTHVFDLLDLDAPLYVGYHQHATTSIDHNLYIVGDYVYESNYTAGLRILRLGDLSQAELTEVGYFDVYPANDAAQFHGTWNNYPFFASGVVIVSGIEQGLFVLRPEFCSDPAPPSALSAEAAGDGAIELDWTPSPTPGVTYRVERALGGCGEAFATAASDVATSAYVDDPVSGQVTYGYRVRAEAPGEACASAATACVETSTTGACTAPPVFAGLATAAGGADEPCAIALAWTPATPSCGGAVRYEVHRSGTPGFAPSGATRIASDLAGTVFDDLFVDSGATLFYVVRARDGASGAVDPNVVERFATALGSGTSDGTWQTGAEIGDLFPEARIDTPISFSTTPGTHAPEHIAWHLSSERAATGARSFHSGAETGICVPLALPELELTASESSALSFSSLHALEAGADGGVVEISDDGGAIWQTLPLAGGYPGSFGVSDDACDYPAAQAAFTGTDLDWSLRSVDLSPWQGESVLVRFRYSADGATTLEGWYLDDLAVTHAQVPAACTTSGLFRDNFERGDATAWSSAGF